MNRPESEVPTPYAVRCWRCSYTEGQPVELIFLTAEEYNRQMSNPDCIWQCPRCGEPASWDDDNYEASQIQEVAE